MIDGVDQHFDPSQLVVVFDTNVLIPLILPASRSTHLLSRLLAARSHLVLTPQIVDEVEEKLRTKLSLRKWLGVSDSDIDEFLTRLVTISRLLSGTRPAHGAVPADPDDEPIIAAALEADADYIVSDDKHLLQLDAYQGIRIINRAEFSTELDRLGFPDSEQPPATPV
jgi:putative PIN family toxin of toxin-antitoxin system